jgi:hypothetical protein
VLRAIDLADPANPLPGTLSLVPADLDDPRRLEVTVQAQLTAGDTFATRAVVSFQRGAHPGARHLSRVALPRPGEPRGVWS